MIQFLRGDKASLEASEYVPADGQPIYEKDTNLLKVGNDSSNYSALPYLGCSAGGMNWVEINGAYEPENTTSLQSSSSIEPRAPTPTVTKHLRYYIPSGCIGFILDVGFQEGERGYLTVILSRIDINNPLLSITTNNVLQQHSQATLSYSYNSNSRIVDVSVDLYYLSIPQYILCLTDPTA